MIVTATNAYSGLSANASARVKVSHKWGEPTYTWAEDGTSCTAKRVCKDDSSHLETATATVESKITKPATCKDMGETTYTATFTETWAEKQTKTLADINALNHDFSGNYDAFDTAGHWHICNRAGCTATDDKQSHQFTSYSYNNDTTYLEDGTETATCDAAGCSQTATRTAVGTKLVDSNAPNGEIAVKENKWKNFINTVTFGIFCTDKYDVTITATDSESGVASIEYLISENAISKDDIKIQSDWRTYSAFSLNDEGKYIIYAKIIDRVGNTTYLSSNGLVIDRTAPVIRGLENNKNYCGAVTFSVEDSNIDYVTVNGDKVTSYTLKADGTTYTVKAYDKAGNESISYSVTVNNGHTFENYVPNGNATCTEDGTKTANCKFCNATDTVADADSAFGHEWKATVYEWSKDGKVCIASRVCKNDGSHLETATATVSSQITKPATCNDVGETTYTAVFTKSFATAQTKVIDDIPAAGHSWDNPTYEWSEDGKVCKATRVCKNDSSHFETVTAAVSSQITKPATCNDVGETTYTAVFTESFATAQTKVIDDIPATTSKTRPTDTTDSAENKSDNKKSPKTGVNGNMQLWLALLFISGGAVISFSFKSKKENRHG